MDTIYIQSNNTYNFKGPRALALKGKLEANGHKNLSV